MSGDARASLTRLPGCARLAPDALEQLAGAARLEALAADAVLVAEGSPAPDWYAIVESGALEVTREGMAGAALDSLGTGDVLDPGTPGAPAPFSASARGPTRCWLVAQSAVARLRRPPALDPGLGYREELALVTRKVRDLVRGPAVTCPPGAPVAEVARQMTRHGVGSVVVVDEAGGALGIVTDRDLRRKVLAAGLAPATEARVVMSSPVVSIAPDRLAFDALLEMMRRNLHHLGVGEGGRVTGVVSSHDLMLLQGAHPVALAREIEGQPSVDGLTAVAGQVLTLVRRLARDGVAVFDLGRMVAELNDRLVRRAVELAEADALAAGHGRPPVPYSWIAAGSEGRREQTFKTDQDNGLVYEDPPGELREAAGRYFGRLASAVGATLVRVGFPPCDGGFMASNPQWCQPAASWREYFRGWMDTPHPERVLRACIFFDLRPVAGDERPGRALWDWVCERAPGQALFLRHMAKAAVEREPPLGLFGRFVVERSGAHKDALDLKARGVFPVTQAMRVYALSLGIRETSTVDRLVGAGARGVLAPAEVAELRGAYEVVFRLRLERQIACLDAGVPADNFLNPDTLGKADRLLLREAFRTIGWLQRMLEDRFQTGLMA